MRKDYFLPFRIRLEFKDDSPDLVTQIKNILKSEIDKYGFKVESYPDSETTLWEYFHSEPLWKSVTPILIFDQFEEIFTLARKSSHFGTEELATFWEELADLIENSIPEKLKDKFLNDKEKIDYSYNTQKIKTVFAFREEFLPEFEHIASKIPSLKSSRFRLMPMNGNQAYDVITKTWKKEIDEKEAHKMVSYFVNEEEENKSYDLMEVEPSLLSQVCTYIDKERISEGRNKISSDFLEKYPKEKILHSIYEEVLTESNEAVLGPNPDLTKDTKPVNEFLEDKLITDEGYRTKYSLSEIDKTLLPGIEVLKRKYFLRDDGKTVEITHDVLAPIIKDDREARRKAIAVAAARKRAIKRAFLIILWALIAGALFLIAGFLSGKYSKEVIINNAKDSASIILKNANISAKNIKESANKNAKNESDLIKKQIKNDSTSLAQIDSVIKVRKEDTTIYYGNSSDKIARLQKELAALDTRIAALKENKTNDSLKAISLILSLREKVARLKDSLDKLNKEYKRLNNEYAEYRRTHPFAYPPVPFSPLPPPPPDSNSIVLDLHYSLGTKVPHNLLIYLIPDNSANAKIIRKSKVYEIGCDISILTLKDKYSADYYKDDKYVFHDVKPGKYFVKICSYYGGYGPVIKKAHVMKTVNDFDAAPPIR